MSDPRNRKIETTLTVTADNSEQKASLLLAEHTSLSQAQIKDAMQKGAVWMLRGKSKQRLRRASRQLKPGDKLELNYNADLLAQSVPEPQLISDASDYSIWFKPFGLNCQGSRWGDFASINRWVELNLPKLTNTNERPVFLVHRLDRATTGLILLAHSKKAARLFSEMFEQGKMDKRYQAIVHGDFSQIAADHRVDQPVDGKAASSIFNHVDKLKGQSLVDVQLLSGRKHQIRQHLKYLGYPIVGDRLYGDGANDDRDLQLQSVSLGFECPLTGEMKSYSVPYNKKLTLVSTE